jgi:hypothetical protein
MDKCNEQKLESIKKKYKDNPIYRKRINDLEKKFGSRAVYFLAADYTGVLTYPSIFLPNNSLTQTYTMGGGATLFNSWGTNPRYMSTPNNNLGFTLVSSAIASSSVTIVCLLQEGIYVPNLLFSNATTTLTSYHGYIFYFYHASASSVNLTNIYTVNGTTLGNPYSTTIASNQFSIKENNLTLSVAYGTTPTTLSLSSSSLAGIFANNTRYLHVYTYDAGISGTTVTMTMNASYL